MIGIPYFHNQENIMSLVSFFLNFSGIPFDWNTFFGTFLPRKRPRADPDRSPIPEQALREHVRDAIPELALRDMPTPRAWTCETETLPVPLFEKRDVVVWNDAIIPRTHGARKNCGEGPFTVHTVDDFIVAFRTGTPGAIHPIDRLVLECPDGTVIVAHPGYFRKAHG